MSPTSPHGDMLAYLDKQLANLRGYGFEETRNEERYVQLKLGDWAHGVCPCCNRSFSALAKHMKQKHPAYVAASESP